MTTCILVLTVTYVLVFFIIVFVVASGVTAAFGCEILFFIFLSRHVHRVILSKRLQSRVDRLKLDKDFFASPFSSEVYLNLALYCSFLSKNRGLRKRSRTGKRAREGGVVVAHQR